MILVLNNREFLDITESLIVAQWHCKDVEKQQRLEQLRERVNKDFCGQVVAVSAAGVAPEIKYTR